jgi:hypothetical protein
MKQTRCLVPNRSRDALVKTTELVQCRIFDGALVLTWTMSIWAKFKDQGLSATDSKIHNLSKHDSGAFLFWTGL